MNHIIYTFSIAFSSKIIHTLRTMNRIPTITIRRKLTCLYIILLCIVFYSFSTAANAQKNATEYPGKWYVGGSLGAQIGQVTLVDISPIAGYYLTERLTFGAGVTYKFYRIRNYFYNSFTRQWQSMNTHILGGQVFSRFFVAKPVFAHLEYEYLRFSSRVYTLNTAQQSYDKSSRTDHVHSVFIGGGYRQFLGPRSSFDIMLLYNLNETEKSPYQNPLIRMAFTVRL